MKSHKGDGDGWTTIRRKNHKGRSKITSFYVSNISQETTIDVMYEAFQGFGNLVDIYIPGRKDKGGSFFAFIKYENVRDAVEMEKKLNRVRCGHYITKVNISKYEKKLFPYLERLLSLILIGYFSLVFILFSN